MRHVISLLVLSLLFGSCKQDKFKNIEQDEKRPLKAFNEKDVVKYAMSVLSNKPVQNFEVTENNGGFLLTDTINGPNAAQRYMLKIGPHGLILNKEEGGEWTDKFKDRRMLYYEQDGKLILSELFESDSSTYYEFTK